MKTKHILLLLMVWITSFTTALAKQLNVSGTVMDEKGEPLIGVSMAIKEAPSKGAITDLDGHFKITGISAKQTLVVSYIGYSPQTFQINKNNERMRIVLKENATTMDEVVVTASGKVQKKINVTGAITGVDLSSLKSPAASVTNMLAGRVPGVISMTRTGEPGKDFSEFWIRGISTFGAGQGALVLIDGIEGNLNTLDFINEKKARFLKKVEEEGDNEIIFRLSIDHYNELKNDEIRGRGAFRQTFVAVKSLVKYGFNPIFGIVNYFHEDNSVLISEFKRICESFGFETNDYNFQINEYYDRYHPLSDFSTWKDGDFDCKTGRILTENGIYSCPFLANDHRGWMGESFKNYSKKVSPEAGFCLTCSKNKNKMFGLNF